MNPRPSFRLSPLGLAVFTALLLILPTAARSDTIELKNGDRLSGTLVNIASGSVVFRTKLAGKLFVPALQVSALETEGFVLVSLSNDMALPGRIESRDGTFYVVGWGEGEAFAIDLSLIVGVDTLLESEARELYRRPVDPAVLEATRQAGEPWREGTRLKDSAGAAANAGPPQPAGGADIDLNLGEEARVLDRSRRGRQLQLRRLGARLRREPDVELDLDLRYSHNLFGGASFTEGIIVGPLKTDAAALRAGVTMGLRVPVALNARLDFRMLSGYQEDILFSGRDGLTTTVSASIRIEF